MKIHKLLGLAALVMFLGIGCAKKSSTTTDAGGGGDGGGTSGLTLADLDGTWVSNCHFASDSNKYVIITTALTGAGGAFTTVANAWDYDATCSGTPDHLPLYTVTGTASVGAEIANSAYTFTSVVDNVGTFNLSIKNPTATTFIMGDESGTLDETIVYTKQ